jgi:tRNA threonylcarbamoyladenosine biosynthesis protein TsaB
MLLAIESATDLVGAALLGPNGSVAERSHLGGRAHAELLAPAIEEVCALSGCTLADVDALAVDVGPGLFTGLRVGVATAKALGQSLGLGIVGVTSLDILAAGARELAGAGRGGRVVTVVDARRREVFAAAYAFGSTDRVGTDRVGTHGGGADGGGAVGGGVPVDPADVRDDRSEALAPDALVAWLETLAVDGPVLVVGDGAVRYLELLGPIPGVDTSLAGEVAAPSPTTLARLAARRLTAGVDPSTAVDLVPDYRRHADARINWEERAPQRQTPTAGHP